MKVTSAIKSDDMPIGEKQSIHGAGGGIDEGGNVANGFTGVISPYWDV